MVVKKRWLILLLAGSVLATGVFWRPSKPRADISRPVQALAIKVAAGDPNAVAALRSFGSEAVPPLLRLLSAKDGFLRTATWVIAPRVPRRIRKYLLARIGPLEAGGRRAAAARALGVLGPNARSAVPALLDRLHDREPYIAMEAATALSRIGEGSIPGLIKALSQKDSVVRRAAAYALGELGASAEQAIPSLIERLEDVDPQVRSSSAYSLARIGYPAVVVMSNIIDKADADAREAAVKEFIRFYHSLHSMVTPLVKMAHAEKPASRRQAIEALGALRAADDVAVGAMLGALRDPAPEVRLAALKALGLIPWRVSAAVHDLPNCLSDTSPEIRVQAAKLLGSIGPGARSALPDLKRCLRDDAVPVRAAAQAAIDKVALTDSSDLPVKAP